MNILFIPLFVSLMCGYHCVYFCDLKSIDNVFNVGHLVHMTRCGQVWTYDPKMNSGEGGFIKDYSWYSFARQRLVDNILAKNLVFDYKFFRFAAFIFTEIECFNENENIAKNCPKAIRDWNNLGVIVDNFTAITFFYEFDFELRNDSENGLGFAAKKSMEPGERDPFWPNIAQLTSTEYDKSKDADIYSALYSPIEMFLYIVLYSNEKKLFYLTFTDMKPRLHDLRESLKRKKRDEKVVKWADPFIFTGHVVGMFYDWKENKSYIVGRFAHDDQLEDQVYTMTATIGNKVNLKPMYMRDSLSSAKPLNLRTYFGCDPEPTPKFPSRKKRSIEKKVAEKSKPLGRLSWRAIDNELRDNWFQLSIMSFVALFMSFLLYKLSKN